MCDWNAQQFVEVGKYGRTYGSNCEIVSTIWNASADMKMWLLGHLLLL